jgi:hypothetical protein
MEIIAERRRSHLYPRPYANLTAEVVLNRTRMESVKKDHQDGLVEFLQRTSEPTAAAKANQPSFQSGFPKAGHRSATRMRRNWPWPMTR